MVLFDSESGMVYDRIDTDNRIHGRKSRCLKLELGSLYHSPIL